MVSSLLPLDAAVGGGALLHRTATRLLGTSVLRRVRQAAECRTAGATGEKESNKELFLRVANTPPLLLNLLTCTQVEAKLWELENIPLPCAYKSGAGPVNTPGPAESPNWRTWEGPAELRGTTWARQAPARALGRP